MSKKLLKNEPVFHRSDAQEMFDRCHFSLVDLMGIIYGSNAEININIKPSGDIQFNLKEDCADRKCYKTVYEFSNGAGYEEMFVKK